MKKSILMFLLVLVGLSSAAAQDRNVVPLVREGVKWVNEKVVVIHGDTTRYYYNYEISGYDSLTGTMGPVMNACYYYLDDNLDVDRDSLIAGLHQYPGTFSAVTCFRNIAYDIQYDRQMCMLRFVMGTDGGTRALYWFGTDPEENKTTEYYFFCQDTTYRYLPEWLSPFLTEDNFKEVDPVEIDGEQCRRSAYLDDDGNPLAYVVEGIGFDSRELGDLLTPFTRKPDPDADYQEWCGLSHVVKDGKIIYKGMRYREDTLSGIGEAVADKPTATCRDENYYDLMGRRVGRDVPTTPGIYIHQGKKIVVR